MPAVSRRTFVKSTGAALAGSVVAPSIVLGKARRAPMRVALVGTGVRGITMWGRDLVREYPDEVEFVGLCDINPGRLEYGKRFIGADCPTFTHFDAMVEQTKPTHVIVCTRDDTHHLYINRGMELGCDIITEKPMTTDAEKCQSIVDTQAATGQNVTVTFNYRYSPHRQRIKEILQSGRIGKVTSVDFHWYLDIYHGAAYFRRWHGKERFGGTLFVHKACHHFDLVNWWLESEPETVVAMGDLEYYGENNPYHSTKCRGCQFSDECAHYWDITKSDFDTKLYTDHEHHDGYLRDGCVWDPAIDIYDKMAATIRYANGVQMSYSCTTYSPYEGYRIAFNGTKGRLEAWGKERPPWEAEDYDELRVTANFGETELIQIPHGGGGHGGGDTRLKDPIFKDPNAPDPYRQAANHRDGAMAVLPGIAAHKSVQEGRIVHISEISSLTPRAQRL